MGKRAARTSSIVGSFFPLLWQGSVASSTAPKVVPLALVAARAPLAVSSEDAQSGNTHATTPDGPGALPVDVPSCCATLVVCR